MRRRARSFRLFGWSATAMYGRRFGLRLRIVKDDGREYLRVQGKERTTHRLHLKFRPSEIEILLTAANESHSSLYNWAKRTLLSEAQWHLTSETAPHVSAVATRDQSMPTSSADDAAATGKQPS